MDPWATLQRYTDAHADGNTDELLDALDDLDQWVSRGGSVSPDVVRRLIELLAIRSQEAHSW